MSKNMQFLNELEKATYLESNILPSYKAALDIDKLEMTLFSTEGKLIITTNYIAKSVGFNDYQKLVGKTYTEILIEELKILPDLENKEKLYANLVSSFQKIHKLFKLVVQLKRVINYIDFIPYDTNFKAYQVFLSPVFHPRGEVVAIQATGCDFHFIGSEQILNHSIEVTLPAIANNDKKHESHINLSPKQRQIVFLISNGFSQEEVAQMLNIHRGTLTRYLSEHICQKFNIHGSNTKLLIQKAKEYGYADSLPYDMWIWGIIIPNPEIAALIESLD